MSKVRSATEHLVSPLTHQERAKLAATFAALARLFDDPRSNWLLGRPGLVDVLLRTGKTVDPAGLMCEADVFAAVWQALIRKDEVHASGAASPDDREQATICVAKRTLGIVGEPPHGSAASELRLDGVLRTPNNPAFAPGDEFATDLFRDFALCRLSITNGWEALALRGAPRWTIRAARLACQAALVSGDHAAAWRNLRTRFSEIAATQGDRWLEIPHEALLTLGDAELVLQALWTPLIADVDGLKTLLRLAQSRYVRGSIGDAFSLAPIVKVAFCDGRAIDTDARVGHQSMQGGLFKTVSSEGGPQWFGAAQTGFQ